MHEDIKKKAKIMCNENPLEEEKNAFVLIEKMKDANNHYSKEIERILCRKETHPDVKFSL